MHEFLFQSHDITRAEAAIMLEEFTWEQQAIIGTVAVVNVRPTLNRYNREPKPSEPMSYINSGQSYGRN